MGKIMSMESIAWRSQRFWFGSLEIRPKYDFQVYIMNGDNQVVVKSKKERETIKIKRCSMNERSEIIKKIKKKL